MNLAQAVAVCLYGIVRLQKAPRGSSRVPAALTEAASSAAQERLTSALLDALQASGYLKIPSPVGRQKIRRLVRRLRLGPGDAETLVGMLRQILWKLHATSGP